MSDDGYLLDVLFVVEESHGRLNLPRGLFRAQQWNARRGGAAHLGIAVRAAITHEVERPRVEAGFRQIFHPGVAAERKCSRQPRWKCSAMYEENRLHALCWSMRWREMT